MNELIAVSILWLAIGALAIWYTDYKAYDNGFIDAVQLHSEGRLTYTVEMEEEGINLITIEVNPYEE